MSDSPELNTGFAKVTRETLRRLAKRHEVTAVGWFGSGGGNWPYEVLPGGDDFGRTSLPSPILRERPDIVILQGDVWTIEWAAGLGSRFDVPVVVAVPSDGSARLSGR